jgi:hypothetical protein
MLHTLQTHHIYDIIDETMKILHIQKKCRLSNTLERFHLYNLSLQKQQMNDKFTRTDISNPTFDIILKTYPSYFHIIILHLPPLLIPFPTIDRNPSPHLSRLKYNLKYTQHITQLIINSLTTMPG